MMEKKYWKISPGEYAYLKDEFISKEIVALGANDVGDISKLSDDEIIQKVKEIYGEKARFYSQLIEFLNKFIVGDKVLLYGKSSILAIGEIDSEYKYDKQERYHHTRKVKWEKIFDFYDYPIKDFNIDLQKTLQKNRTIVKLTEDEWETIEKYCPTIEDQEDLDEDIIQDEYNFNITKESDLQEFLWYNLSNLEPGLEPLNWELYAEDAGRIDILAKDSSNNLVVIELKAVVADDDTISQILRYIGWVKENYEDYGAIRGIIVSNDFTKRAIYAASAVENIKLVKYTVSFDFNNI